LQLVVWLFIDIPDEGILSFLQIIAHHHNVWLISVPTGRFAADASLSRRAELPGASDEPLRFAAGSHL